MEALEDRLAPASLLPNASPNPAAATTPVAFTGLNSGTIAPNNVAAPAASPQTNGVNLIIPTLAQGQASSAFGFNSATFAGFPFFESAIIQNPDVATNLFQGTTSLSNLTTRFSGLERFSVVFPFWQFLNSVQLASLGLGHLSPSSVVPVATQNPVNFLMPSSGTAEPQLAPGLPQQIFQLPGSPPSQLLHGPHSGTNAASAISGTVFRDLNGNGVQDRNELGISGVRVVLEAQKGEALQAISTTVTDASGRYTFPHLTAGTYRVRVEPPVGLQAEQATRSLTVAPSAKAIDQNFGLTPRKKPEKPPRTPPAAKPQSALPLRPATLVDQVFAGWDGDSLLGDARVDHIFASEDNATGSADAGMLVGAAIAAVAEFNLFEDRERFWETDDVSWRERE